MNQDVVWECDYGNRLPVKGVIKTILSEQGANSLQMVQAFINNNPYNFELYVVFSYDRPNADHISRLRNLMVQVGMVERPDINFMELLQEIGRKRFNSIQFIDPEQTELTFETMFAFKDRKEAERLWPTSPLGTALPVFISHSSKDKSIVEGFLPYLTGANIPIWYDKIDIDYGDSIVTAIQSGIKRSGIALFWITRNFLGSNWCSTETETFLTILASKGELLIIAIVDESVDVAELPLFIQNKKYLRISLHDREKLNSIAMEIIPTLRKYYKNKSNI